MANRDFEHFLRGYVTAALWSSSDESDESGGEPLDRNYSESDIAAGTMRRMRMECMRFFKANRADLVEYCIQRRIDPSQGTCMDYAGHDFWLSSNGHGSGFFDRYDVDKVLRDRLQNASKHAHGLDLYVGDDGEIHHGRVSERHRGRWAR